MTKTEAILIQFTALINNGKVTAAAQIYYDWAYSLRKEFNAILAISDEVTAQAISDEVTNMSGDYIDQP